MAAGFDSLVTDRTNRMRWPHGRMRYNLAMLAELSKLRLLPFRMPFDDGDEIATDLTLAAFGNTRSYGGGMLICPDADHDDGQLDITMVHSASRTRLIRLFPTVFKGTHVDLDEVTTARARSVSVDSPGINAYADGEFVFALPVRRVRGPRSAAHPLPKRTNGRISSSGSRLIVDLGATARSRQPLSPPRG